MTKLCFVDTETTSLDDRTGEIWEIALIVRTERNEIGDVDDTEYLWQLPVDLAQADPMSLQINNFHDRRWPEYFDAEDRSDAEAELGTVTENGIIVPFHRMNTFGDRFIELTRGAHFIANVPSFNDLRLRNLLRELHQCPMWHYHLVCVENLIAGRLGIQPPWKSKELSEAIGVPVPEDQHGAMPDTRWARDMYDAVFSNYRRTSTVITDELNTAVGEAIGEASMCWTPTPSGVFDSTRASKIVDDLLMNIRSGL